MLVHGQLTEQLLASSSFIRRMYSHKKEIEIRFDLDDTSPKYLLLVPSKIISRHVAKCGWLHAYTPLTTGGEDAFVDFLCLTVIHLYNISQGGEGSITAAKALSVEMDKAKSRLLADDLQTVMSTIEILLTDDAWGAMKACLLNFIRNDYCKDFFSQVCKPVMRPFKTLRGGDLFTGYQYLLGRSADIITTIKSIVIGLDQSKMSSDMRLLRFYANAKPVATLDDFLEGLVICSTFGILQGLY